MINTYDVPLRKNNYFISENTTRGGDSKTFGRSIGDRRGPDKNFNKINGLSRNPWYGLLSCMFRGL